MKLNLPFCAVFLAVGLGSVPAFAGPLLTLDFNKENPWKEAVVQTSGKNVKAMVEWLPVGTIDQYRTSTRTGALNLAVDSSNAGDAWEAAAVSGPLPVTNTEPNLGKLTLSFMLSASAARPVRVLIESLDAAGAPTGGLSGVVHPAAPDFYQRYALDLDTLHPVQDGKFDPLATTIRLTFGVAREASGGGWPTAVDDAISIDNVSYASPAYYVSPAGDDSHDGLTEQTAFAHPQAALDVAGPGDIILLMDGTYGEGRQGPTQTASAVASFRVPGSPAAWITLKNYPGQHPTILARGTQGIRIAQGTKKTRLGSPILAYLEVRGLHIRGNGDTAREEFAGQLGTANPMLDCAGIYLRPIDTQFNIYHHIRIADNLIEYCTADGLYLDAVDWFTIENNRVENNCWTTTAYVPSGLTLLKFANFDLVDNATKILVAGNRISGNRRYVKHPQNGWFNGNGILIDASAETPETANLGRYLLTNNLVFNNGGGGIQMWGSRRIDIVNNTLWQNGTQPGAWGQVGFEFTDDVRFINNIVVAQPDRPLDAWYLKQADRKTSHQFRANNLYFGGGKPHIPGVNDLVADPLFVHADADASVADFHLKAESPARNAGRWEPFGPSLDLDGKLRPGEASPDLGAYQAPGSQNR